MLVSVIIPVYNASKTVERSILSVIESVSNVTLDYEIICVDDGSTDNSLQILNEVNKVNNKVIVLHQENAGAAAARNKGLDIATGEYIAFNDSDDEWMLDHFEKVYNFFLYNNDCMCLCGNHDVEKQNLRFLKSTSDNIYTVTLYAQQFKNYFSPPNAMIKRIIIDEGIRFDESMRGSEEVLFYNHILKTYKSYYMNTKLSQSILHKYRYGDFGLSGNLWVMEKGELYALKNAKNELNIPFIIFLGATIWSVIKYFRRVFIVFLRRITKK